MLIREKAPIWPKEDLDADATVIEKITRLFRGEFLPEEISVYHVDLKRDGSWLASVLCKVGKLEHYFKVACSGRSIYTWTEPIFSNTNIRGFEI